MIIGVLIGTAVLFRLIRLSSVPGVSGDEGWWGIQALAWLSGAPYETHTTSGNPVDLFLLVPVALVHAFAEPSIALLRAVPALVNILGLPVAFLFVRRLYGTTTAWIHTVSLAVLPSAIAHGRICQDPSQTVFWTGIFIYVALLGLKAPRGAWLHLGAAVLLFPVVLWTHPTNIFVAPFLLLPLAAAVRPLLTRSWRLAAIVLVAATGVAAAGWPVVMGVLRRVAGPSKYFDEPWLSVAAARLADGAQWFEFAANNGRLLNGVTIYHYFSGARPWTVPYDVVFVIYVSLVMAGFVLIPATKRSRLDAGLLLACVGTWLFFYAFAGPAALRPHFERWGLCLLVPASLVLARGLTAWIVWRPSARPLAIGAAACIAASLLMSFYVNYFREFARSGGRSHLAYVTAPVEPKQQALEQILATSPGPMPIAIFAQQWWLARPIAYLAAPHANVAVSRGLKVEDPSALEEAMARGRVFFVEFAGTPELEAAYEWARGRGMRADSTTIADAGGRPLLEILHVTPAAR